MRDVRSDTILGSIIHTVGYGSLPITGMGMDTRGPDRALSRCAVVVRGHAIAWVGAGMHVLVDKYPAGCHRRRRRHEVVRGARVQGGVDEGEGERGVWCVGRTKRARDGASDGRANDTRWVIPSELLMLLCQRVYKFQTVYPVILTNAEFHSCPVH